MSTIRKLWLKWFPKYRRLELVMVSYSEGDKLINGNAGKPETKCWQVAKEEDYSSAYNRVYLERRERILS